MKHDLCTPEGMEGVAACRKCGGAEGTLSTDCPGNLLTEEQQLGVFYGILDFKEGYWINPDTGEVIS